MMTMRQRVAVALLLIAAAGCKKKIEPVKIGLDAALVTGADLVARLDMDALRAAPMFATFKDAETNTPAQNKALEFWKPFGESTGLTRDDLAGVVLSADLDGVDFNDTSPNHKSMEKVEAVMAFELKKALTLDQLKAGLASLDPPGHHSDMTEITVAGTTALKDTDGPIVCLTDGGKSIFLAPTELCLGRALERIKTNKAEDLSPAMTAAFKALPGAPQVRAALVLTDALQAKLKANVAAKKQQAQNDPGAAMMVGTLGSLAELKGVGLSVTMASDFSLSLGGVFKTADAAIQLKTSLTMGLNILMMMGQKNAPAAAQILGQNLRITQTNTLMNIRLTLTDADIQTLKKAGPPAHATGVKK